ncbi:Hexitol phosphatase B [bioreactor metagenome]|uniref:Hexitol phosphatase B n=1 Tax=bioreactor metagenome TaxID=1076179 RepID=A0A645D9E0_9ZZZZ
MGIWKQVDLEFLGSRGLELPEDLQCSIEGMSFTETAGYFKNRFSLKEEIEEIKAEWNCMAEEYYKSRIALKRGVKEFLELIYERGLKIAIATSNSRELVQHILKNHGIEYYFSVIRTSCEVPKGKPYPDVYLKVAEDLEVSPVNCIAFEDTLAGVMAAKSAGMKVIAVSDETSLCSKEKIAELTEDYINDFFDVIKKVE